MSEKKSIPTKQWRYVIINGNHSVFDISKECARLDIIALTYPYNGMVAVLAYGSEKDFNMLVDDLMILEGF